MKELSYKERFLRLLRREPVDRVAIPSFCTHPLVELMDQTGLSAPDIHNKRDDMVNFALAMYEILGFEGVRLPTDGAFEAQALGCAIDPGTKDRNPTVAQHPFTINTFEIPDDFMTRERIPIYLEAVKSVRNKLGDDIPATAHFQGPMTLACHLVGSENFLLGLVEDKEGSKKFLETIVDRVCIKMANELSSAGADVLMTPDPLSSSDIISPSMFDEFIRPCYVRMFEKIACPVVLHICGNTTPILPLLKGIGAAGFSFDVTVNVLDAKKILGTEMCLIGNISTTETLLKGSREDVRRECLDAIRNGIDVLAPSCGFAPYTPLENIREMIRTATGSSDI
jgi:[methyl-Co(III) methanol-specific corrinoid protein]:coenzyme M methyltransferase